jgi:hypothetical protein
MKGFLEFLCLNRRTSNPKRLEAVAARQDAAQQGNHAAIARRGYESYITIDSSASAIGHIASR